MSLRVTIGERSGCIGTQSVGLKKPCCPSANTPFQYWYVGASAGLEEETDTVYLQYIYSTLQLKKCT